MIKKMTSKPEIGLYIADDAHVLGNVSIGEGSSVWYHSVLRAEHAPISIGSQSNIQDGCILHTDEGHPVEIGDKVTVGHGAIIHGCRIGSETLIGMGAIILNGAVIGKNCIIGAGALVTQGMEVPDGHLAFGSPAKVKRPLTAEEKEANLLAAEEYIHFAKDHFE